MKYFFVLMTIEYTSQIDGTCLTLQGKSNSWKLGLCGSMIFLVLSCVQKIGRLLWDHDSLLRSEASANSFPLSHIKRNYPYPSLCCMQCVCVCDKGKMNKRTDKVYHVPWLLSNAAATSCWKVANRNSQTQMCLFQLGVRQAIRQLLRMSLVWSVQ
jgi:hypothetical protein